MNAITQARSALQLVPIYLNSPTVVGRSTLIGAAHAADIMLADLPSVTVVLAEVFRKVSVVAGSNGVAYVTLTKDAEKPYGAVVADEQGRLLAVAAGSSPEGLAELIRLKLQPPPVGYGEAI